MHGYRMPRNPHSEDQEGAAREQAARWVLAERTGLGEHRAPAFRLLQEYADWAARQPDDDQRDAALAALALLPVARADLDTLESGVLFAAKTAGLTWAQMAAPMGLGSAQAAHQRLDRLNSRQARS